MIIDLSSFALNSSIVSGGGTPSWGTALGQSRPEYKFTYPDHESIIVGMLYKSVPKGKDISFAVGKGGSLLSTIENTEVQIVSIFDKVFVNGVSIGYPFIMFIVKEEGTHHAGRKSLKYPKSAVKRENGTIKHSNEIFLQKVEQKLGMTANACWFVYKIEIWNQEELHLFAKIVDSKNSKSYPDAATRKLEWLNLLDEKTKQAIASQNNAGAPVLPPSNTQTSNVTSFEQKIYYGVPGCGKSHFIENKLAGKDEKTCPRVVFHPEYTNTDFIGQILPSVDANGKVDYSFTPGPFTLVLLKACANLNIAYYLIIEEINRGNAAAIFGEVFQLLDRKSDGWSKYSVVNRDIIDYVQKIIDGKITNALISKDEASRALDHLKNGIRLPQNLSILATMNSSDQNVFTLDNAFQRRFDMELIPNKFADDLDVAPETEEKKLAKKQRDAKIDLLGISWSTFQVEINKLIAKLSKERGLSSMEDKRIGCWFVKNDGKDSSCIPTDSFANKVLKYLWDDAFKFDREKIFEKKYESLESLINAFKAGHTIFLSSILKNMGAKVAETEVSEED